MTTVRDLITDALLDLGALSDFEAMTANQAAQGLRVLNRMLQGWNTENLMVYTLNPQVFPLVGSKQSYTLGVGGDFSVPRPVQIDKAVLRVTSQTPNLDLNLHLYSDEEWEALPVKQISGTYPTGVWITGDYPLNKLWLWPTPSVPNSLVLYTWGKTEAFTSLDDAVLFPDGYEEAIVSNLSVRLSPSYGIPVPAVTMGLAGSSKMRIASMNWEPSYSTSELAGRGSSLANQSRGLVVD